MAPKFPLSRAFSDREKNSSILVENDLDLTDCWNERVAPAAARWRVSCLDKKRAATTWGSRLSSLSSNLRGLTTRAKQLQVGEATRRVITQLRSSMVEPSTPDESLPRAAAAMSTQHFNESDLEDFGDQPETEDESCDDCYLKEDKRSSLRVSRSWAL